MMNDPNAASSSLWRRARRLPVLIGGWCALFLVGCVANERWETLSEYRWHGHDGQTFPSPAESDRRVPVAESGAALLSEIKDETLTAWREYMAECAVENYRSRASAELDPQRRDKICAEFLDQAIQEHIEYFPAEKIDYELFRRGMDSGLEAPPPPRTIDNQDHYKLVDNDKADELNAYYENCDLYNKRGTMIRNIRRVCDDNRLSEEAVRDRFPLVMMLHYEQIGRGIMLERAFEKLREGL